MSEDHREIIRLRTTFWKDERGMHIRRDLIPLKRKCSGHQILDHDSDMIGCEDVISHIVNLSECKDGIYSVVTTNERRDWESGYIEEYDYKLVPNDLP